MPQERRKAARRKRRSFQQMMEEDSGKILRGALPRHWVIHEYTPDYGIDGTIEIFEFVDEDELYAETLGETILFQLKSVQLCNARWVDLPSRMNVEKFPYKRDEGKGDSVSVEVIDFQIDTDELVTIEAMGSGIVVLLLLVCLDSEKVFFVNLTDLVDKVLTPESPEWREQRSKSVMIPVLNELTPHTSLQGLLRFYGARSKLTGMFTKVHFQWAELAYGLKELSEDDWYAMLRHFTDALLRLDIWEHPAWHYPLARYGESLTDLQNFIAEHGAQEINREQVVDLWFRMDAISRTFEDVAREWGLPTQLGHISSYPPSWLGEGWKAVPREERAS